jgi:hypothetical protein
MANENQNTGAPKSSTGADEAKKLQNVFKALVRDGADFGDIIKDQVNELKKLQTGYDKVRASIEGFRTNALDVKKIQSDINDQVSKQFINAAKLKATELELVKLGATQLQGAKEYTRILSNKEKAEANYSRAVISGDEAQIALTREKLDLAEQLFDAATQNLTPLQAEYIARSKSKDVISLTVKELQTQLSKEKEIQSQIGLTGKVFENFSKKLGLGNDVYEAMVRRARELQVQNTKEFKEEIKRKNERIQAINEVRKSQGKKPIALIELPKGGVLRAGFNQFKKDFADSWKNDPLFKAGLFLGAAKALNSALQGTIKMFRDGMVGGMKALGGELAEGPIQNLTKPISGFLEKIPLIGGLLGGVVDLMATFMDYAMNANSQFVKMGRELGLTADESQKLANNFSNYANSTNDVFVNSKKLYEAQIGLSKQLGTTAILSNEILSTNIRLKDVLGLEEDIQATIAQTSVITGKESQNIVGNVIAQVNNLKKAGLATQDYKAVLKEVSNLGGYLGLTFAKYPEKLTKAVLQTKAMGLELKQLDAIADSFLDYESSITKEMEAQVLTGKDINLNKAREAFLNNDLVKAAEEITKQVGSVDAFLKMDRIRAESLASAFGMSRDALADMLKKQTFLGKIGAKGNENAQQQYDLAKKYFATMKDVTTEQEKQQYQALASGAANERLAALIDKIKQGFTDLISNSGVSKFIDKAIDFMSNPNKIQGVVNGLKDFFATVLEMTGSIINAFSKVANVFLFGDDEIAENYGDTIKDFAGTLRGKNLTKLDEGGLVQTSGIAEVHSGETYLGANSLQVIKMTAENSRKTVELLAKLANQKSDGSNAQIKFVTGNVVLDGVPTGKLMLNSFENNSYTKFDTTRYNS